MLESMCGTVPGPEQSGTQFPWQQEHSPVLAEPEGLFLATVLCAVITFSF